MNISFFHLPKTPYQRLVYDYKEANVYKNIQKSIVIFDWENPFSKTIAAQQVLLMTEALTNIFTNVIPNKSITFSDKNPTWWLIILETKLNGKMRSSIILSEMPALLMTLKNFKMQ